MAIKDVIIQYWYVLAILGLLVIWWIWGRMSFYTKKTIKEFLTPTRIFLFAFILVWYFWAKYGSVEEFANANFYMPMLGLLYFVGVNLIGKLRYQTQQVICSNFHGSFSKPPLRVNGFLIFAIDSFNAGGLAWDDAKRVLVLREETCELFERGAVSIARVAPVLIYDLDPDVKLEIERNKNLKRAKNEVYYGWFDDINEVDWTPEELEQFEREKINTNEIYNFLKKELGVQNPSIKEMYRILKNVSKSYNRLAEEFDNAIVGIEKGVEHHKRVRDAYIDKPEKNQGMQGGFEEQ